MLEDVELLNQYFRENREQAFAELVRRRVDFVFGSALRRVGGDVQLAKDVTQLVFTTLARDGKSLCRHPALSGWLYITTRFIAAQTVRGERRRRTREQAAHAMNENSSAARSAADWERLRPELDAAMDQLNKQDREAVLLRFFEERSFADIGAKFRLSENAARMRVERALEKMQATLVRRGVTSTVTALGLALVQEAGAAAPVGLGASVTGSALVGASSASIGALGLWNFMCASKIVIGIGSVLAVLGIATAIYADCEINRRDLLLRLASEEQVQLRAQMSRLEGRLAVETKRYQEAEADNAETLDLTAKILAKSAAASSELNGGPLTYATVSARYRQAFEFASKGEVAGALKEYLWCFDDGMSRVSAFRVARRGALLNAVAKLGEQYPEALNALRERRDLAEKNMLGSAYDLDSVADFVSLNRALNDINRTLAQFDQLPADDPRHRAMASWGFDQLVTAQRYGDAAQAKSFAQMESQFETAAHYNPPAAVLNQEEVRKDAHDVAVNSATNSIEVLAGAGDLAGARTLADKLLAFDGSIQVKATLQDRLARAGHPTLLSPREDQIKH